MQPSFGDVLDILGLHLLVLVPPEDAHQLSHVSRDCRDVVMQYYKRHAIGHVRPGGAWHMRLCKRSRDSISSSKHISYTPLGVASLVQQKCGVCRQRFLGACHPAFGILVHKDCARPLLLNTYYIRADYSLKEEDFKDHVPLHTLHGHMGWHGDYNYNVVWKDCKHGLVPYSWTSEYIVNVLCEKQTALVRRQREEAEIRRLEEERKLEQKRKDARDKRMKKLLTLVNADVVDNVSGSGLATFFCPRFFGYSDVRCPDSAETTAHIVCILHQLLVAGHSSFRIRSRLRSVRDWSKYTGLQSVLQGREWTQGTSSTHTSILTCQSCNNLAARHCNKCAKCCDGCSRHRVNGKEMAQKSVH